MESGSIKNFDFILKTSIKGYYDLLRNAEKAWDTQGTLTYIVLRMVIEDLFIKLQENYDLKKGKDLSLKGSISALEGYVPKWILEYAEYIRIKDEKSVNKEIDNSLDDNKTLLALERAHKILIWYLKNISKEINLDEEFTFITPESLRESECDLAIDKKVLENKEKFIISLEKQIKTSKSDEKKQEELYELLKNVKEEKKELIDKLNKKELELQEALKSFKKLQDTLLNYLERDKNALENNNKYKDFYKGFLSLQGYELRVVYAFLKSLSVGSIFINKSKGIFIKSKRKEFLQFIEKEVEDLKAYSDGILKLKLYYSLLKLTNTPSESLLDKKNFDKSLDSIVEKSYFLIEGRNGFSGKVDKLEAIINYYLIVIIDAILGDISGEKDKDIKLCTIIYEVLISIPLEERNLILKKMDFTDNSEEAIKENIRLNQEKFLKEALKCGTNESLDFVLRSIFSIYVAFQKDFDFYEFRTRHDMIRVYIGPLLLYILLKEFKTSRDSLLPIFVMEISISNKILKKEKKDSIYYNQLLKVWEEEKEEYEKILSEKRNLQKNLKQAEERRELLLINEKKFISEKENTENAIDSHWDMFRERVLEAEEIKSFDIYEDYKVFKNQKNLIEISEEHSLKNRGFIKNLFSIDTWKYKLNKLELDKNIKELEDEIVEEAKEAEAFKRDVLVIKELENILQDKKLGIEAIKSELKENNLEKERINKLILSMDKEISRFKEDNFDFAK